MSVESTPIELVILVINFGGSSQSAYMRADGLGMTTKLLKSFGKPSSTALSALA
jgi:hypothetical protein